MSMTYPDSMRIWKCDGRRDQGPRTKKPRTKDHVHDISRFDENLEMSRIVHFFALSAKCPDLRKSWTFCGRATLVWGKSRRVHFFSAHDNALVWVYTQCV